MRPSLSSLDCASLGTSARAEDDTSVAGAAIYVRTYVYKIKITLKGTTAAAVVYYGLWT